MVGIDQKTSRMVVMVLDSVGAWIHMLPLLLAHGTTCCCCLSVSLGKSRATPFPHQLCTNGEMHFHLRRDIDIRKGFGLSFSLFVFFFLSVSLFTLAIFVYYCCGLINGARGENGGCNEWKD